MLSLLNKNLVYFIQFSLYITIFLKGINIQHTEKLGETGTFGDAINSLLNCLKKKKQILVTIQTW